MGPEDGKRRKDPRNLGVLRSFRTGNGPSARCIYGGAGRLFDNLKIGSGREAQGSGSGKVTNGADFTRQENWIRGNKRTVRRQYAARNWTFVRVLPGIAGYCRVVGRWGKKFGVESEEGGHRSAMPLPSDGRQSGN